MALAAQQTPCSWCADESAMVLSNIFSADISIAIWQRDPNVIISHYFTEVLPFLGLGIRQVFSMATLKEGLDELLPDAQGKTEAVADIYLLSDMLTCLFNCDSVGLRLAPLDKAMCPKFHTDNIPVRLVHTYLGPGTQWLPNEMLQINSAASKSSARFPHGENDIQQMNAFEVGLLKGSAWEGQEQLAAIHRSCQVKEGEKRVLLTLDPL